jgi:hypothetical protein
LCPMEREEFKAKSMKIFIDYDVAYHIIPMLKFQPFTTGCKPNLQLHVYEYRGLCSFILFSYTLFFTLLNMSSSVKIKKQIKVCLFELCTLFSTVCIALILCSLLYLT